MREILQADLTWTGERFERDVQVAVSGGRITGVGPHIGTVTRPMPGRALLPGFVNAHSHAFQRGLRGHGEQFPAGAGSFWSWREGMYGLVERLDAAAVYAISRQAFIEMLAAGITTVGEFHYLRHEDPRRADYRLDEAIVRAATDAGIRLVLLATCYRTGGFDEPPGPAQRRFVSPSLDAFWQQQDALASRLDAVRQTLGVAAHSVRAVPVGELAPLHAEASRRGMVLHMHLEEQPREIAECKARHGMTPVQLVAEIGILDERFTAVHCTHTTARDLGRLAAAGARACICPLTEANLGDGIPDGPAMRAAGIDPCLGTDSNARLSMTEEARWLEYAQRLARVTRGEWTDRDGSCARALLRAATVNGARALGIDAGEIRPGAHADLIALDLHSPSLAGWTSETLLESFLLGSGNEAITETLVG